MSDLNNNLQNINLKYVTKESYTKMGKKSEYFNSHFTKKATFLTKFNREKSDKITKKS
jgi:hypothetical protein